jgi:hydroxyacylglutathione hydrolase
MKMTYSIQQFEDKSLSHFAYAILSQGEMILIDPARNPQPYYDWAKEQKAKIVGVIETHPHADFVSSHLEIHNTTGAIIYASKMLGAAYAHTAFDEGATIQLGSIKLKALNTPGHSPDSICIVLESEGKDKAVFTGDTLFIGDCGRPDLREQAGHTTATRDILAKDMYSSLRDKLMVLDDAVLIYPAHGAGSLCGKGLSDAKSSTIGAEKLSNWSLKNMSESEFVSELLKDQPLIPKYFSFDVAINKKGADAFKSSVAAVPHISGPTCKNYKLVLEPDILIVDSRSQEKYVEEHFDNSINLQTGLKFETWLGSIIAPEEPFYLLAETTDALKMLIERVAKIGYEGQIKGGFIASPCSKQVAKLGLNYFITHQNDFTILDIRTPSEVNEKNIFDKAIHIPLSELRERMTEIPLDKPIVVHCAGGYRSAAGSSLLKTLIPNNVPIFDLGEDIKTLSDAIH